MAKRFEFRLEAVLKVRRRKEDEKKRVVAERIREMTRAKGQMALLNEQIASSIEEAAHSRENGQVDAGLLARQRYWISRLQHNVLETELQIIQLEKQLVADRRQLAAAAREVRVLEKLREKRYQRYLKEMEREEIIEADELATQRFISGSGVEHFVIL